MATNVRTRTGLTAALATIAAATAAQRIDISRGSIAAAVNTLKPGQFVWAPRASPSGPLLLVVNTTSQRALLFRNGVPIAASTISTGRSGHDTPTGIFTVLQKQIEHYSSKYDSAPMPYMQRLTWSGVALHAGNLPGYPASHGCIRLPAEFAKLLYGVTALGMTVVITDQRTAPRIAPVPQLVVQGGPDAGASPEAPIWRPEASPSGPLSIVVSAEDRRAVVLRNGVLIGSAPVSVSGPVAGTWAYTLRSIDAGGQHWVRIGLSQAAGEEDVPPAEWQRFEAPVWFRDAVRRVVEPGTTIVVTADSLRAGATSAPVMVIESDDKRS